MPLRVKAFWRSLNGSCRSQSHFTSAFRSVVGRAVTAFTRSRLGLTSLPIVDAIERVLPLIFHMHAARRPSLSLYLKLLAAPCSSNPSPHAHTTTPIPLNLRYPGFCLNFEASLPTTQLFLSLTTYSINFYGAREEPRRSSESRVRETRK